MAQSLHLGIFSDPLLTYLLDPFGIYTYFDLKVIWKGRIGRHTVHPFAIGTSPHLTCLPRCLEKVMELIVESAALVPIVNLLFFMSMSLSRWWFQTPYFQMGWFKHQLVISCFFSLWKGDQNILQYRAMEKWMERRWLLDHSFRIRT